MTKEKFGILENMKILEAIGVAQEGLHSIKTKKKKYVVLIIHAYDRVTGTS